MKNFIMTMLEKLNLVNVTPALVKVQSPHFAYPNTGRKRRKITREINHRDSM